MKIGNIQGIQGLQGNQGVKGFDARLLSGKILYPDVNFEVGLNDVRVYDNSSSGTVTITRIASPVGTPKVVGSVLEIKHTSDVTHPGFGGFTFANMSRANATFVCKFKAKLPVGRKLIFASNPWGDNGTYEWITSQYGTGRWEDYVCVVKCGDIGTFSSINFFYVDGGNNPSVAVPLIWYLSDATVYDVDGVADSVVLMSSLNQSFTDQTFNLPLSVRNAVLLNADSGMGSVVTLLTGIKTTDNYEAYLSVLNANGATLKLPHNGGVTNIPKGDGTFLSVTFKFHDNSTSYNLVLDGFYKIFSILSGTVITVYVIPLYVPASGGAMMAS
jgi:hypothetical protein